jgi:sugar phosphate isomerase/epimerase
MFTTRTGSYPIGFRKGWTAWFNDLEGVTDWAVSNGISVVDFGADVVEHLSKVTAKGLQVGSVDLVAWQGLISEDPADRAASIKANEKIIVAATKAGVKNFFIVMLPNDPKRSRSENFGYMLQSLQELGKILEANGGRMVIEGWPGEGALCCTPEGYRACLAATPKSIGINYDPSHLIRMGIDPIRFLREFKDRVYHVHGKDCEVINEGFYEFGTEQSATFAKPADFGGATWRYTIPGHGATRWAEVFSILKESGYQGAVSIELEDANFNGTETGEKAGILAGCHFLASC